MKRPEARAPARINLAALNTYLLRCPRRVQQRFDRLDRLTRAPRSARCTRAGSAAARRMRLAECARLRRALPSVFGVETLLPRTAALRRLNRYSAASLPIRVRTQTHTGKSVQTLTCRGRLSGSADRLEVIESPVKYSASQGNEHSEAQEGNTFVIQESDLQNAGSTSFINFHTARWKCSARAPSQSSSNPPIDVTRTGVGSFPNSRSMRVLQRLLRL